MWHEVCEISDIPVKTQKCVRAGGHNILLCHTDDGLFAIRNQCTHAQATLEGGRIENGLIRCPMHGARFELATGKPVRAPSLSPVKSYPVKIDQGAVQINIE